MLDKLLFDWIRVHVVEFFPQLRARIPIEIVISALPESAQLASGFWEAQSELAFSGTLSAARAARYSLLEYFNNFRWANAAGFTDQQVNMFGHDDVAREGQAVPGAILLENLDGKISGAGGAKQGPALIATKGDEMQVVVAGEAFEVLGHRSEERPTRCARYYDAASERFLCENPIIRWLG